MSYSTLINQFLVAERQKAVGVNDGTIVYDGIPYWNGSYQWEWSIDEIGGLIILEFRRNSNFGNQSFRMEIKIKTLEGSNERYYDLINFSCENLMNFANICALTENVQRIVFNAINSRPA